MRVTLLKKMLTNNVVGRFYSFLHLQLDDEAFGYLKRVIVTPAVYPRFIEFHHFDIQSTGQKSHCVNNDYVHRNALF